MLPLSRAWDGVGFFGKLPQPILLNEANKLRIVALIAGFCFVLLFFFVPETFWDRTPRPRTKRPGMHRSVSDLVTQTLHRGRHPAPSETDHPSRPATARKKGVGFANTDVDEKGEAVEHHDHSEKAPTTEDAVLEAPKENEPSAVGHLQIPTLKGSHIPDLEAGRPLSSRGDSVGPAPPEQVQQIYTSNLRAKPPVTFVQTLKLFNGRLAHDRWHRVVVRPLILFAYPAVLWSAMVYALSVGWLIVLSESVAHIFQNRHSYNFSALTTGLVYLSPFVGGILGTAVAGKVSDVIVRYMSRRNGGVYEPEYRLVMAIPVALSTAAGLMGFGWSAEEKDLWIVPTIFFGIISFGCTLGSTTAITFCVDSYRQYAGEALVTLNFCKSMPSFLPLSHLPLYIEILTIIQISSTASFSPSSSSTGSNPAAQRTSSSLSAASRSRACLLRFLCIFMERG